MGLTPSHLQLSPTDIMRSKASVGGMSDGRKCVQFSWGPALATADSAPVTIFSTDPEAIRRLIDALTMAASILEGASLHDQAGRAKTVIVPPPPAPPEDEGDPNPGVGGNH